MTKDEVLKMALEALENTDRSKLFELERNAIATIKEILAPVKWTPEDMAYRPGGMSQLEQEPWVQCTTVNNNCLGGCRDRKEHEHYTSPPKRQPLTDDEIYEMYNEPRSDAEMIEFARAIEAAHGIGDKT
jgi:hypothetical protein